MRNKRIWYFSFALIALLLALNCTNLSTPLEQDISLYLPESGEVEGWQRIRALQSYTGEDLFLYINGGAEIY
ncbi:MAG: hypothetical protein PVF22_05570, partial [Candidatus Aminicenantes bacterium]